VCSSDLAGDPVAKQEFAPHRAKLKTVLKQTALERQHSHP